MPEWVGTFSSVAITFLFFVVGSFPLAFLFRDGMRRISLQYAAILAAGLSIFSATFEAENFASAWNIRLLERPIAAARRHVDSEIETSRESACNARFVRSEVSLPDSDELMAQLAKSCEIIGRLSDAFIEESLEGDGVLVVPELGQSELTHPYAKQFIVWIERQVNGYNELVRERDALKTRAGSQSNEIILIVFAPYLAALAVALALALATFPANADT